MSVSTTGIQNSELVIARILSLLMEWGIQRCDLQFKELELEPQYGTYFFPCIKWLVSEKVISVDDIAEDLSGDGGGVVINPCLTSFGLYAMGVTLKFSDGETTLGDTVKARSDGQVSVSKVGDFTGSLLGGFFKSISS